MVSHSSGSNRLATTPTFMSMGVVPVRLQQQHNKNTQTHTLSLMRGCVVLPLSVVKEAPVWIGIAPLAVPQIVTKPSHVRSTGGVTDSAPSVLFALPKLPLVHFPRHFLTRRPLVLGQSSPTQTTYGKNKNVNSETRNPKSLASKL